MTEMTCLVISDQGRRIAARIGCSDIRSFSRAELQECWEPDRMLVLIMAVPAAVRIISAHLTQKERDPAIICIDQGCNFVVPLVGSHSGSNALARRAAGLLGAQAVITTASDAAWSPALDGFRGFSVLGDVAAIIASTNAGAPPRILNPFNLRVPLALSSGEGPNEVLIDDNAGRIEEFLARDGGASARAALIPRQYVVGLGCSSDATADQLAELFGAAISAAGIHPRAIGAVATINIRATHPAIVTLGYPIISYDADELADIAVPTPSSDVFAHVGTASVAEAAALRAAGSGSHLVVEKVKNSHATAAIAKAPCRGRLSVCGIGPGAMDLIAPRSAARIAEADAIIGFEAYVSSIKELTSPNQYLDPSPIGDELKRARRALELASLGHNVVLLGSGDPGVYALATLVYELAGSTDEKGSDPEIEVVPGITAGLAASSLLGAPLGHDHCYISLSDLLTPYSVIEERIEAAAVGDFVVVFYNPRSKGRDWHLGRAMEILAKHRPSNTPVGIVKDAYRPNQLVTLTTIENFDPISVDMTTVVLVGSTQSYAKGSKFVTPRGYSNGADDESHNDQT